MVFLLYFKSNILKKSNTASAAVYGAASVAAAAISHASTDAD